MRIEQSLVDYSARHALVQQREIRERVTVSSAAPPAEEAAAGCEDPRLTLARMVIQRLLGGRFAAPSAVRLAHPAPVQPRWNVAITRREVYQEAEGSVVRSRGSLRTAEGATINFAAEFTLFRSFRSDTAVAAGSANLGDPLFLQTAAGYGLLFDDADGDGQVSGASEIFGAATGNGFAELARLDSDGNGWIDEGDQAFGRLRLRFDGMGLQTLEEAGIGALSTSSVESPFQFKNAANELTAVLRRTGIYLTGQGRPGALRQIDIVL